MKVMCGATSVRMINWPQWRTTRSCGHRVHLLYAIRSRSVRAFPGVGACRRYEQLAQLVRNRRKT